MNKTFPNLLQESPLLLRTLHSQQFIEYIRNKEHIKAIEYAQNNLNNCQNEIIYTLNSKELYQETHIDVNLLLLLLLFIHYNIGFNGFNLLSRS